MKVIGVIPARWGSTRFPGKSLAMLAGKPVIQWVFERASMAQHLDSVVVATDDVRIRDAVEGFGGRCAMTRSDHPSGTDRVAEAARNTGADIVINIQGDEPFIEPRVIDDLAVVMAADASWDMATAVIPIENTDDLNDSSIVKVAWGQDRQALFFSRSVIPFDRDRKYNPGSLIYWRHVGIYAYRIAFLEKLVVSPVCMLEEVERLEQLRALYMGGRIKVIEAQGAGVGIDTPADLAKAESVIRTKGLLQK